MAGWKTLLDQKASNYPDGTQAPGQIDDIIEALIEAVVDGAIVEHSCGDDTAGFQGYHRFPASGSLPTATARPAGHIYFQSGLADTLMLFRNAGSSYSAVGAAWKTVLSGSVAVGTGVTTRIAIAAYSAAHAEWIISAYTPLPTATNPKVVYGTPGASADVFAYLERDAAGNNNLVIANNTANAETVFYRVRQSVG